MMREARTGESPRIDMHGCITLRKVDEGMLHQLLRFKKSGFDAVGINIGFDAMPWEETMGMLTFLRDFIVRNGDKYTIVKLADDITQARKDGKLGVFFDIEGGKALNDQLSMVSAYHTLGVRWMLLAYNKRNSLCGGCLDTVDEGLTDFGRQVIDRMGQLGMLVCCSHMGYRSAEEAIDRNPNPSIFSHSNPRAMFDHPRNIPDGLMKKCAARGGVMGINGIGIFLGNNISTAARLTEHIDHAVQTVGVEHVGLGLDYMADEKEQNDFVKSHPEIYPPAQFPDGINMVPPERLSEIEDTLVKKGYGRSDIDRIFGGNWMRVMGAVWK